MTKEKLSDAQWSVLAHIEAHGPFKALEVMGPRKMDGSRKIKIESNVLNVATLDNLSRRGLVHVERGETRRPVNAVGKSGHARTDLTISLTEAGRAAIN